MRHFQQTFAITAETRILDVGGSRSCWELLTVRPRITFLNLAGFPPDASARRQWVIADGCVLPFADASFDVVFSNSVIEHVGGPERQSLFAREAARAGKAYWIQTPNRWFPIETHMWTPFVHFLPPRWQAAIVARFTVWQMMTHPTPQQRDSYLRHFLSDIRLLDAAGLRTLFPGSTVVRERFLGFTKSLIAVKVCDNEGPSTPSPMDQAILKKMQQDWDARARENARYYVATGKNDWTDDEFFASGERTIAEEIQTDMINICQGKDPREMRVLEIGCGAGRITRALSNVFGEVHGVDVSGEMISRAKLALSDRPGVHVYQNNGVDLSVIPADLVFDFAFSTIVFQHIPSRDVIENYVREVHRVLRPGALFKFQVQGDASLATAPDDTWLGVPFSDQQAVDMANRCGFEPRHRHGVGEQYFWLWFFKR